MVLGTGIDEVCRRIRSGGSPTSMALGREYGISCGSSTATLRRTGWTMQLDGAALCVVSSSLQHLASHVSAWPQRSHLKHLNILLKTSASWVEKFTLIDVQWQLANFRKWGLLIASNPHFRKFVNMVGTLSAEGGRRQLANFRK